MNYKLLSNNNRILVNVDVFSIGGKVDICTHISIPEYTKLVLMVNKEEIWKLIRDFNDINVLRDWIFDEYVDGVEESIDEEWVNSNVETTLSNVAKYWGAYGVVFVK